MAGVSPRVLACSKLYRHLLGAPQNELAESAFFDPSRSDPQYFIGVLVRLKDKRQIMVIGNQFVGHLRLMELIASTYGNEAIKSWRCAFEVRVEHGVIKEAINLSGTFDEMALPNRIKDLRDFLKTQRPDLLPADGSAIFRSYNPKGPVAQHLDANLNRAGLAHFVHDAAESLAAALMYSEEAGRRLWKLEGRLTVPIREEIQEVRGMLRGAKRQFEVTRMMIEMFERDGFTLPDFEIAKQKIDQVVLGTGEISSNDIHELQRVLDRVNQFRFGEVNRRMVLILPRNN